MLRIFLAGMLIVFSSELLPQTPMVITRMTGAINFDGIPDEVVWQSVPALPMVMHKPDFGKEPTETTVAKILYDDEYLYVSGYINFKDPSNIRAVGKKRDYRTGSSDWLGITLDSYYDRKNAFGFYTNPNGVRLDTQFQNDYADPAADVNWSWDTFWDVKTAISNQGWSAEIRIPFSSLRFQTENNSTNMGITVLRSSPGLLMPEMSTFPAIPPDYAGPFYKPSLTAPIVFYGINPDKPLYFAPYLSVGVGQANKVNEAGTGYKMSSTFKYEAGLDLKYSLTNNLTMDFTVNTDFADVEADDQKINLTRYSLYFPEKRDFFLEKADVFDFSFLGGNNMFYSRRIGLYDGYPVRIYGGARMTGRINKWDIGFLDLQTSHFEENPSENFGVFRTKRSVFNQNSYIGGIVTSKLGMNGNYNLGYGFDGVVKVISDDYLTIRWAQTFENDSANKFLDMFPSRFLIEWEHRLQTGFGYDFVYTWSGDQFNPGVGFEAKDNYYGYRGILRYGWLPGNNKPIKYHKTSLTYYDFWNTRSGLHETTFSALEWYFEARKGSTGTATLTLESEDLVKDLPLGNNQANVTPGNYLFMFLTAQYSTSSKHALSSGFKCEAGSFYDGRKLSFSATPKINIGASFSVNLTYNLDYVNFPDRSIQFTNHILGVKGEMTLTTKTSLSAFAQYNTSVNKVYSNVRFRFNPKEGNDLWLVYDEGLNTSLMRETPTLPLTSTRTILLKYTYTFRF
ncbi:MAG: DUF5916 domain-containing protein [Bacteroidia bacterium]|nr:DUF5916 domain-containing protein [Bacteroidia bacterium]